METIIINILEHIASTMPQLATIDEDCGQLDFAEDQYPVIFPCVLVSTPECTWRQLGRGVQEATVTLTTRMAVDCYHDTHVGAGTHKEIASRYREANTLFQLLSGFRPTRHCTPLVRMHSRQYSLPGNIKVYETAYTFTYYDESGQFPNRQHP